MGDQQSQTGCDLWLGGGIGGDASCAAPVSPKVKVEPAEQLTSWTQLDELPLPSPLQGRARCSFQPGCCCSICRTIVIDDPVEETIAISARGMRFRAPAVPAALVRGRGAPGVPRKCGKCGKPKKGHVCEYASK